MDKKLVVVINGAGGVGKDALIKKAASRYGVWNISAVEKIKEAAKVLGWTGEKSDKSRKLLADLKKLSVEYNDGPTEYLLQRYREFVSGNGYGARVMFVHIREPEEIDKFKAAIKKCDADQPVVTLLIRRPEVDGKEYGNRSDDEVRNYMYDMTFFNDKPLDQSAESFLRMMDYFLLLSADAGEEEDGS